ncbi:type II secretion system F family protein [Peterkaempfera bronchialis]|uniref:Type II secretion system protein GspF domain-containing protein n=1 Tax=Peterkaempfera bronchialis TaxID=2126346 RepID=A0A345SYL6_9ACTN|nr:type II secretion system F family protein [Peterkaempfera bronchialis]AXI78821.1 hypothetical protein C7M71_016760 [Peterkaempfera bronchialis]
MAAQVVVGAAAAGVCGLLCAAAAGRARRMARRRGAVLGRAVGSELRPLRPRPGRVRAAAQRLRAADRHSLRRLAPWAAGAGAALLVGGIPGALLGPVAGVALHRVLRRMPPAGAGAPAADHRLEAQLPLTAELLAACLGAAGVPSDAAEAVSRAVGSPMRDRLAAVAAELRLGADPADCWERLGDGCPALAPLGRCLARAGTSGAPPAATLARLAEEQRGAATRSATARTRRAGVLATAPLGVCFLPAFVLIGIVPVVSGLASAFLAPR